MDWSLSAAASQPFSWRSLSATARQREAMAGLWSRAASWAARLGPVKRRGGSVTPVPSFSMRAALSGWSWARGMRIWGTPAASEAAVVPMPP